MKAKGNKRPILSLDWVSLLSAFLDSTTQEVFVDDEEEPLYSLITTAKAVAAAAAVAAATVAAATATAAAAVAAAVDSFAATADRNSLSE